MVIDLPGGGGAELVRGRLLRCWGADGAMPLAGMSGDDAPPDPSVDEPAVPDLPGLGPPLPPPSRDVADELMCVAAWLEREAPRVRLARCDHGLAEPYPPLPSFEPRSAGIGRRR